MTLPLEAWADIATCVSVYARNCHLDCIALGRHRPGSEGCESHCRRAHRSLRAVQVECESQHPDAEKWCACGHPQWVHSPACEICAKSRDVDKHCRGFVGVRL